MKNKEIHWTTEINLRIVFLSVMFFFTLQDIGSICVWTIGDFEQIQKKWVVIFWKTNLSKSEVKWIRGSKVESQLKVKIAWCLFPSLRKHLPSPSVNFYCLPPSFQILPSVRVVHFSYSRSPTFPSTPLSNFKSFASFNTYLIIRTFLFSFQSLTSCLPPFHFCQSLVLPYFIVFPQLIFISSVFALILVSFSQ